VAPGPYPRPAAGTVRAALGADEAEIRHPDKWAMSEGGNHLPGVVQRFETFAFVVRSHVI
jgi:hypothetical protein